ncbi:TatD family hydrolase [Sphingobacterium endophyticum]|uniref:TatD family hydrolase n=1 Tax=Sphingobacterium endophyticum TaxID=2546448 RepID=UPI0012E29AB1|nr:TatD family hydrolase [Sphingobacterium endophyticum]
MLLIDIHTHKHAEPDPGVLTLPNVIVSKESIYRTPCSAGIHPWYIDENFDRQFDTLKMYQQKEGVIAVGECGLDKMTRTPWDRQLMAFEKQIELANELNKPLILHCVRAYSEVYAALNNKHNQVPVMMHGYSKNWSLAESLLENGYYLSLGPHILKGGMMEVINNIPLDRLFLECDDKNAKISEIYAYFCRVRKLPLQDLQQQILLNFKRVFNYTI